MMKDIVLGHRLERDELLAGEYVAREGIQDAMRALGNNLIKVITGPRRAGKSVFAIQMLTGVLKNILGFKSVNTVENYVNYLESAYLVFDIGRFSFQVKEQMKSPRKAYAYDAGMINSVKIKTSSDVGRVIENLVAVELLRDGGEYFSYKTTSGKEVDFALKKGLDIERLIQVSYDIENPTIKKRETGALVKSSKETGCDDLLVLTWDYEARETASGKSIHFTPLWKWLLERSRAE